MSFPYLLTQGFESGGKGTITAEVDTAGILDFPHYTALASQGLAPWRGAYCMRIRPNSGTTAAYIREDAAFDDLLANVVRFVRFYFYLGKDFVMADTNKFSLMEMESVLDTTTEVACGIDRSGANIRFWVAETSAAAAQTMVLGTTTTALGRWYHAELRVDLDSGAPNDGTIDAYIDDAQVGAQITALDQGAIVDVKFGVIGPDAGTSGAVLMDDITYDELRIYRDREQYRSSNAWVNQVDDHPIIGAGKFKASVTGTGTNAVLTLYDSDGVPNSLTPLATIRNVSANEYVPSQDELEVNHGLYCTLSGTEAQAYISISRGSVFSDATMINRGLGKGTFKA